MNEDAIVAWIKREADKAGVARSGLVLGIGDDCAILSPRAGEDLVFTTDQLVEGVHFDATHTPAMTPAQIGARVLARNLSDLAAMGAEPRFCLVNLAVPQSTPERFVKAFFRGLLKLAAQTGTALAGGDLAHSENIHCDVTACGAVPHGKALRRDGAEAGDRLYVSGPLGKPLNSSWNRPIHPRLELGIKLRGRATACMDVSDGLSRDLPRLCRASGVAAELDNVPVRRGSTIEWALHGGEDYELLFTISASRKAPAGSICIGRMVDGSPGRVTFRGVKLEPGGYDHFGNAS